MSVLLIYHDKDRGVVCSDDRATSPNREPMLDIRIPKFIVLNNSVILGSLGRADVIETLWNGTRRMCAEREVTFAWLTGALPKIAAQLFAARRRVEIAEKDDGVDIVCMGFDVNHRRVRAFVWRSQDGFKPIETTASPDNRVLCLGAFDLSSENVLAQLTARMAKPAGLPWIASQLRDAVNVLSNKYPAQIGAASYFAAIDRSHGLVELPAHFPALPEVETEVLP